jgi:hypothetical protein
VTLTVAFCLALLLKIFLTIGFALFVGQEKMISRRWKNKNKTLWCLSQNTEAFFLKAEMFRLPAFNFFVNSRKKCIFDARFPLFCIYGVER